jgi:hypothetical protein
MSGLLVSFALLPLRQGYIGLADDPKFLPDQIEVGLGDRLTLVRSLP